MLGPGFSTCIGHTLHDGVTGELVEQRPGQRSGQLDWPHEEGAAYRCPCRWGWDPWLEYLDHGNA